MMKNKKGGFTLVELLAVIVILGVLSTIGVVSVNRYLTQSRKKSYKIMSQTIYEATMNCITQGRCAAPTRSETVVVSTDTLIKYGYLKKLDNPYRKRSDCSGSVVVKNESTDNNSEYQKYTYDVQLTCDGVANNTLTWPDEKSGKTDLDDLKIEPITRPASFSTDSWSMIANAIRTNTYPYKVGDTKIVDMGSLGTHTVRIANTSPCTNGETSQTACGFVVEFADIISKQAMNSQGDTRGGWLASSMRSYVNSTIYNALPKDLQSVIAQTKVISGHGRSWNEGNFESTDKLYLLSSKEVWGEATTGDLSYTTANSTTKQLDYYKSKVSVGSNGVPSDYSVTIKKYNGSNDVWWLRSPMGDYTFIGVLSFGNNSNISPGNINGVSPAFRIA